MDHFNESALARSYGYLLKFMNVPMYELAESNIGTIQTSAADGLQCKPFSGGRGADELVHLYTPFTLFYLIPHFCSKIFLHKT